MSLSRILLQILEATTAAQRRSFQTSYKIILEDGMKLRNSGLLKRTGLKAEA
jgi:hypothetical protein